MAIQSGTRLGLYEVVAQIGAGGMGEVYQARDSKLGREVAVKVLPERFASDTERLARFQREAKTLAALNHPNIATIHGLEQYGDTHFLVMELVPGETLAQMIKRSGTLPLEEALKICKQIAEALEAAHEKGIIHRDLKPANVKVTPEGRVKVLDFGLAKAFAAEPSGEDLSNSPTLTALPTQAGVIMGTAAYMSPEQARGKNVSRASDIWGFGAVLYELLTTRQAFPGEEVTDVLVAVMTKEPDWEALPANTPSAISRLLRRCLRRDRQQRLQDAATLRIEIEDVLSGTKDAEAVSAPLAVAAAPSRGKLRAVLTSAAVGVSVLVAAGASFIAYRAKRPFDRPAMHFSDDVGSVLLNGVGGPSVTISPDGSRLAYVARGTDGAMRISVRLLQNSSAAVLPGTDSAEGPFFSPDGRWIGFFLGTSLKKISVEGGSAILICGTGGNPRGGGFWDRDDNIYFANQTTPILRVSAGGGKPEPVVPLENGKITNRSPQVLPGGDAILFEASKDNNSWNDADIQVYSLKTKQSTTLVRAAIYGRYIHGSDPSQGHLLYMQGNTVFAAPMDLRRLELTGPGLPMLQDVAARSANGLAHYAVSDSGTMVYITGTVVSQSRVLAWLDSSGNPQVLPVPPKILYQRPNISPDGKRIAVAATEEGGDDLFVIDLNSNRMTRLTFVKRLNAGPVWAPDGKHIVFNLPTAELKGKGFYWIRSDGAGEPEFLWTWSAEQSSENFSNVTVDSISPDGKRLNYTEVYGADSAIWTLPLDLTDPEHPKTGKPELFLKSQQTLLRTPKFSPDGRWVAYSSGTSPATEEIFVRPFPGPGGQWQISTTGGTGPIWSRDGQRIFYKTNGPEGQLMVAPYSVSGGLFVPGQPQTFFKQSSGPSDIAPDGKRIIEVLPTPGSTPVPQTHLSFLLHFADELQRKMAAEK